MSAPNNLKPVSEAVRLQIDEIVRERVAVAVGEFKRSMQLNDEALAKRMQRVADLLEKWEREGAPTPRITD